MFENSFYLIIPPVVAITYCILFKKAAQGLSLGIISAVAMITEFSPRTFISKLLEETLKIFNNAGNMYVLGFTLLIGIVLETIHRTGADKHFTNFLSAKLGVNNKIKARLVPFKLGTLIFTDTNLSIVSSGIVGRSLFDRFKISRQALAFLIDATCAPVSVLILLNGWGAYVSELLATNNVPDPMGVTFASINYNFYPVIIILIALFTVFTGRYFGPLAKCEPATLTFKNSDHSHSFEFMTIAVLAFPLTCVVLFTLLFLMQTGNGDIRRGSGSFSVFWAITLSVVIQFLICWMGNLFKTKRDYLRAFTRGTCSMKDMALIMFLAFLFGSVVKELGTGVYLSDITKQSIDPRFIPSAVFFLSAFVGFTTGTSWGTYGLMIPIATSLSLSTGLDISMMTAAVLGGGVFGDHASPLSDTTILSSMIAGVELNDHVYTQLPYAFFAALATSILYVVVA